MAEILNLGKIKDNVSEFCDGCNKHPEIFHYTADQARGSARVTWHMDEGEIRKAPIFEGLPMDPNMPMLCKIVCPRCMGTGLKPLLMKNDLRVLVGL